MTTAFMSLSSIHQPRQLSLFCWILDKSNRSLPVDIEDNLTVGHLKDAIVKKNPVSFEGVDAYEIDLWKTSFPIDRQLKKLISSQKFLEDEALLEGIRLSKIFPPPGPSDETLHIVVRHPRPHKFSTANSLGDLPLKRSQFAPPGEIDKVIDQFLFKCRPRIQELVNSVDNIPSFLPSWQPDTSADEAFKHHMSKLAIPAIDANRPSLLLHNLGEDKTKLEKERISRISAVFCRQEHTVLLNTSGSGKTRLLLDGLCHHWGFYFAADTKEVGSEDFRTIIDQFNEYRDFERAKEMNESRGLSQLLLSRFLLLELLVEEFSQKRSHQISSLQNRRLWVLLQVRPRQIFGTDPFLELAQLLRPANQSDLETRIRNKCQELAFRLNFLNRESFYCVLDEAQITTDPQCKDFFSEDGSSRRLLLKEIWRSWTTVLNIHDMSFIISGTSINYQEITRTLASNVFKLQNYQVKRDVGAFDDQEDQAAYIQLYIPADWMDTRWQEFLKRSWAWFRGRYRNTATLVSLILLVGYNSPHRTINSYVKSFTTFQPTDADEWTNSEPEHPPLPSLGKLDFDRMSPTQATTLAGVLFDQMLYGTYSLMEFSEEEQAPFIEYGFARTKALAGSRSPQTVLDEPIAILAAMTWVAQNGQLSFSEALRHDIAKHSNTGNGFENYLAFYVRKFFETPKQLDELFEFRSDFNEIDWKSQEFELVTISRAADSDQPHVSIVTPASGPSSNLGLRAQTGEDVLAWISANQDQFTFCLPPNHFGSDLMFFIRSTVSKQLLLVMVQAKNHYEVKLQVLIEGVRTVTPDWFWKSKAIKYKTAAASVFPQGAPSNASELADQTCDALQDIPCGLTVTKAKYPLLRVFASWPGDAKLDRSKKKPKQKSSANKRKRSANKEVEENPPYDVDPHPLAALHMVNFKSVSKEIGLQWFYGDVEQKEVVHAKRSAGSAGLDLRKSKRAREQPGEDVEMV